MIRVFMIGYSENKGGVESFIDNLNAYLDQEEFQVIHSLPQMEVNGRQWIKPRNRHNYLMYYIFWKKFYRENHFDVLYYNVCDIVSIDQLKFAKAAGVPVRIIHSHSSGFQQGITHELNLFHKWSEKSSKRNLDKFATHLFACSKVAGDETFDGRVYRIIRNGINLPKYSFHPEIRLQIRERLEIRDECLIGVIGRLSPEKNPLFAVEIARVLKQKKANAKIVMIGGGELRGEVEAAIKANNLQDNVILTGAVGNVHEWLSAVDCILMPSLFEGLPFVLVEAQAAGLHCVVSSTVSEEANITGLVEYVSLNEGPEVWADRVLAACKKPRENVQQKLIDAGYSIENTAREVSDLIEKSLGKT